LRAIESWLTKPERKAFGRKAEIYLAAVAYMELGDPAADRALIKLRADVGPLHRFPGHGSPASR